MSCNNLTLLLDEKDIKPLYEMITLNHLMYLLGYKSNRPNTIFFSEKRRLSMGEFSTNGKCV